MKFHLHSFFFNLIIGGIVGHFMAHGEYANASIAAATFFGVNAIGAELNNNRK